MSSIYEKIGGAPTVQKLAEVFCLRLQNHPNLKDMFPQDISKVTKNQYLLLTEYFGGQKLYSDKKGHINLQKRHSRMQVTQEGVKAWLECMEESLDELGIENEIQNEIILLFKERAYKMIKKEPEF